MLASLQYFVVFWAIKTQTLEFPGFLCLQRFRRMLEFSGCDEPKNAGIPKCLFWALKHADFQPGYLVSGARKHTGFSRMSGFLS